MSQKKWKKSKWMFLEKNFEKGKKINKGYVNVVFVMNKKKFGVNQNYWSKLKENGK